MSLVGFGAILRLEAQPVGHSTGFTGAAVEEVFEGVLVDQAHAPALRSDAVLYLLLLRLRGERLQLHLQRGHEQGAVLLWEKVGLLWVLRCAPTAPHVPPGVLEPAMLLLGCMTAAHGVGRGQRAPTTRQGSPGRCRTAGVGTDGMESSCSAGRCPCAPWAHRRGQQQQAGVLHAQSGAESPGTPRAWG